MIYSGRFWGWLISCLIHDLVPSSGTLKIIAFHNSLMYFLLYLNMRLFLRAGKYILFWDAAWWRWIVELLVNKCSSRRFHLSWSTLTAVRRRIRQAFYWLLVSPYPWRLRFDTTHDLLHERVISASLSGGIVSLGLSETMRNTMNDGSWHNIGSLQWKIPLNL